MQPTDRCPILLTKGYVAWVSPHRYAEINQHKWFAAWNERKKCHIAVRNLRIHPGRGGQRQIYMHREILGLCYGDERKGDHKNLDSLDNRDENLRIATHAQQQYNRRVFHQSKSGLKGVATKPNGRFEAKIRCNGVIYQLGSFDTALLAHAAYAKAALEMHGEFARLA